MIDYAEKLKDPRWQKLRLKVFERDGWRCSSCLSDGETLHVHHLIYSSGEPWEAPLENLETLCQGCHEWREDFNSFWGRCLIPTAYCRFFVDFFKPAFDGSCEEAKKIETLDELTKTLKRFKLARQESASADRIAAEGT